MKVKKKSDVIEELKSVFPQYSEKEIDEAYSFYWEQGVYDALNNPTDLTVSVQRLGTFHFTKSKLEWLIDRYTKNYGDCVEGSSKHQYYSNILPLLHKLLEQRTNEYEKREIKRVQKRTYKETVEKQTGNS